MIAVSIKREGYRFVKRTPANNGPSQQHTHAMPKKTQETRARTGMNNEQIAIMNPNAPIFDVASSYKGRKETKGISAGTLTVLPQTGVAGIVFYYSAAGFTMADSGATYHYLEAAPHDIPGTFTWASLNFKDTDIPGTDTRIGSGRKNTALILAADPNAPAAKACKELTIGGITGWFLPSNDELAKLKEKMDSVGNMELGEYWSSSQYGNAFNVALAVDFNPNGSTFIARGKNSNVTNGNLRVRAIRAF